ncbi:trypsin-like peptidase domain-containing protein [Streptomyces albireticuli]|uniref:trypsin-like peptidase domain-containing protein n=1 Tax=Streptomyces albireticuli TaxID=1940 RepID=UPI001474847F|nr:trypsin-like peptidase domain-containing protein [Streptomyces albireticuli]MCD9144006.1 serine protease [Streptomyces albireticuli]MCD9162351.1 serine protease [Streptomyces albireticuli]MCD9195480.1 serine protease [Streptomyces albireticuli]
MSGRRTDADENLVRIRDLAGRPRGTGFLADDRGTMITSHEAVDGLARLVLLAPGERTCLVGAEAVTPLPGSDLALVRTEGLGVQPLPVAAAEYLEDGAEVRLRAGRWQNARIVGEALVTYTATDRFHLLDAAVELSVGERDGLRLGEEATGGPVLDARTGTVVAVLGTALHAERRSGGFAIPLRAAALACPDGPLARLLEHNGATVPAYGPDLNLAGALQLTATSLGPVTTSRVWRDPVDRPEVAREFARFLDTGRRPRERVPCGLDHDVHGEVTVAAGPAPGLPAETCGGPDAAAYGAEGPYGVAGPYGSEGSYGAEGPYEPEEPYGRGADASYAPGSPVQGDTGATPGEVPPDDAPEEDGAGAESAEDPEGGRPPGARVLGLVGGPGTGRTTELGALATRRARGPEPAPTIWLRGADLEDGDESVRDAVARALEAAGRIVTASAGAAGTVGDPAEATPEAVAALAQRVGRPLLVVLDGPEEVPPVLAHALPSWTAATAEWLDSTAARLVVACRPEHWETAGALFPRAALHTPLDTAVHRGLPACVRLTDLTPCQAAQARAVYGVPAEAIQEADAAHPLALRLLAEVRAALPVHGGRAWAAGGDVPDGSEDGSAPPPDRWGVFAAYLDLICLRIAVRLSADRRPPLRGTAVRRLAARVAGQLHEAARRCLGPGQGELDREAFEELFPWRNGWASAVLTEGMLVPAGTGYRFGHEEFADWLQGAHLDLDAALHTLVHRWYEPEGPPAETEPRLPSRPGGGPAPEGHVPPPPGSSRPPRTAAARRRTRAGARGKERPKPVPVPRHRIGPVLQALLLLGRRSGPEELATRLDGLIHAAEALSLAPRPSAEADEHVPALPDPAWWAAHLLGETLLRVPDATPYLDTLRLLAERLTTRSLAIGGFDSDPAGSLGGLAEFGPWFWLRLPLGLADRLDLLRLLVPADGPPPGAAQTQQLEPQAHHAAHPPQSDRFLPTVATVLAEDPCAAQTLLCRWFADERPLQGPPYGDCVRPTVSTAAQVLLHTHRHHAVDDLAESLVDAGHPRADELLVALAEDEPSAICRAVDRWAHDDRVERHVAAAAYALKTAPHVTTTADRELLRYSALALLARPAEGALHGTALCLLVRDDETRGKYLPQALVRFAAGDAHVPARALAAALSTHPEPVLAVFRARLYEPGDGPGEVLAALADVTTPALARRAASLVREHVEHRPEGAGHAAAFVDRRLEAGPAARSVLFPLVVQLLGNRSAQVRRALAPVLAAPGTPLSRPLRQELLEVLLEREQYGPFERDITVLDALLRAVATGAAERAEARTRDLVHRIGLLMARSAEGAACFDRRLTQLAREAPVFGGQVRGWLRSAPAQWAVVVGPQARIRLTAEEDDEDLTVGGPADAERREPAWHS